MTKNFELETVEDVLALMAAMGWKQAKKTKLTETSIYTFEPKKKALGQPDSVISWFAKDVVKKVSSGNGKVEIVM